MQAMQGAQAGIAQASSSSEAAAKAPAQQYFATLTDYVQLISELNTRERNWWTTINSRGLPNLWRLNYAQAFGMDPSTRANATQKLTYAGPSDSFVRFRINLTRSHVKQRIQIAMGPRPSFRALAVNNDASSLAKVAISAKIVEYLFKVARGEEACFEALESDQWFGEGAVWARWDYDAGDNVKYMAQEPANDQFTGQPLLDPQTQQPLMKPVQRTKKTGQPQFLAVYPWELPRDATARTSPWWIVKEKASKFEVAAYWPELADKILAQTLRRDDPGVVEMFAWDWASVTSDQIIVRHFYHRPCKAVPGGRYVGYVGDVKLWDLPCPLESDVPIVVIRSAKYYGTGFGYPETADLLAPQEMLDELTSQAATNAIKYGNQSLWAEDGVEWDQKRIAQGGGFFTLKANQKPPQTIQWAAFPEIAKFLIEWLPPMMSDLSGMNPVVRGQPESNIQSGAFAALMLNIAEKAQSPTQGEYDTALNRLGNMTLELVRANADTEFAAEVGGSANQPFMEWFTKEDLAGVKKIAIERQSPLMNNTSGRFEVFDRVAKMPKKDRYEAIQMLATGDMTAFTESDMSDIILVRRENELMSQNRPAFASKTDNVLLHNAEHSASLNRLRAMDEPQDPQQKMLWDQAIKLHVDHIAEHALLWVQTEPAYAASLNLPPPPPPPMVNMPPQVGPGGKPMGPPGPKTQGGAGADGQPGTSKLPNMPTAAEPPAEANNKIAA